MITIHDEDTGATTGSFQALRPQNRKIVFQLTSKEKKQKPLAPKEPKRLSLLDVAKLLRPQRWNPLSRTEKYHYPSPLEVPKSTNFSSDETEEPLPPEAAELLSDDIPLVDESEWTRPKEFTVMDLSDRARARNLKWKGSPHVGRDHDIILAKAWLEDRQSSDDDDEDEVMIDETGTKEKQS